MKKNTGKYKTKGLENPLKEFNGGAVRERTDGKGRYDLISPIALRRLALVMERGSAKYSSRNWEKGIPLSRYLDSAVRHLSQYLEGMRDEDHLGQAMFNVHAAIHTEEMVERGKLPRSLNDLQDYT